MSRSQSDEIALNLIRLSKKGRQSPYFSVPPLEEEMKQQEERMYSTVTLCQMKASDL